MRLLKMLFFFASHPIRTTKFLKIVLPIFIKGVTVWGFTPEQLFQFYRKDFIEATKILAPELTNEEVEEVHQHLIQRYN